MRASTTTQRFRKRILFVGFTMAWCCSLTQSRGQTLNFDNEISNRVWNLGDNWNPNGLPTTSTYAAVDWSIAPELYITDGNGTISAIASVGTLAITGGGGAGAVAADGLRVGRCR